MFTSIIFFAAIIFTGLSAGLLFAWAVSVTPGLAKVNNHIYLQAFQSMNRAILNPYFFIIYFAPAIILFLLCFISHEKLNNQEYILLLISTTLYITGVIGITGLGNVPLNNKLESLEIEQTSANEAKDFRIFFEKKWNRLHLIRTIISIMVFILLLILVFK